jgi:hypothetical protein
MKTMTTLFLSAQYQSALSRHQFDDFESIWASEIKWFEEPNQRRGGWSGVGRIELSHNDVNFLNIFVKKQQNHGRLTWRHPIKGEPTFRREFQRLKFLELNRFAAPKVVFYGESGVNGKQRAILVTVALDDFQSFEEVLNDWWLRASRQQQNLLIEKIALELRRFHDLGLVHRALYPKHIFIKNVDQHPEIALIDLEKARFSFFGVYRTFFDLAALNRHSEKLRASQRLAFFMRYLGTERLGWFNKVLCRLIVKRSAR